jgi:glutamate dehydrogenase/leucine dehydrogenase
MGARVVAVSDATIGLVEPKGFDIPELMAIVEKHKSLEPATIGKRVERDDILFEDADLLIPAALENQIRADNANRLKVSVISEGANGPTTPEADEILEARGVHVVPDILANSGGVIVSHFEWVQALSGMYWEESEVNERLEKKLVRTFAEVWKRSQEMKISLRTAAYVVALERVNEVYKYRGIFP